MPNHPHSPTPEAQPTGEPTLLPCPFCGSQPLIEILGGPKSSHRTINCSNKNCGCDLHFYPTEEAAIAAWNKRF